MLKVIINPFKRHKNKNKNIATPPPTPLIQQHQELVEAERKLEIEREDAIKKLREAAQRLIDQTRNGLDNVLNQDIDSVKGCTSKLKENISELKVYKEKINQIKFIIEQIAKGDFAKINELLQNKLFNEIFPNFDIKNFAMQLGIPEIFRYLINEPSFNDQKENIDKQYQESKKEQEEHTLNGSSKQTKNYSKNEMSDRIFISKLSIGSLFYYLSDFFGLKHNETVAYNYQKMLRTINFKEEKHKEGIKLGQFVYNLLNDVLELESELNLSIDTALSLAGLVIIKRNHEMDKEVLEDKIISAFVSGLAIKFYKNDIQNNEDIQKFYNSIYKIAEQTYHRFRYHIKFMNIPYHVRHDQYKIDTAKFKDLIEIVDLMEAYYKIWSNSHYSDGDPKILMKALKYKQEMEIQEKNKKIFKDSPFKNIPSVVDVNQSIIFSSKEKRKYRVVTPEVLEYEFQNKDSILNQHRKFLDNEINSKLKSDQNNTFKITDLSKIESGNNASNNSLDSKKITESHQLIKFSYTNPSTKTISNYIGFHISHPGLHICIEEPEKIEQNSEIHLKSFYVREPLIDNNPKIVEANILEAYRKNDFEYQNLDFGYQKT